MKTRMMWKGIKRRLQCHENDLCELLFSFGLLVNKWESWDAARNGISILCFDGSIYGAEILDIDC